MAQILFRKARYPQVRSCGSRPWEISCNKRGVSDFRPMPLPLVCRGSAPLAGHVLGSANAVGALAGDFAHVRWRLSLIKAGIVRGGTWRCSDAVDPRPCLRRRIGSATGRRDTTQAQLCVGVPALPRDHPDAWALVLNVILGEGMSSRLFLSLVDRDALAYDVSSGLVEYADAGALQSQRRGGSGRVGKTLDGDPA